MTPWIGFFRRICADDRTGSVHYHYAASAPDWMVNRQAAWLGMETMPEGHPIGATREAIEWLQTEVEGK